MNSAGKLCLAAIDSAYLESHGYSAAAGTAVAASPSSLSFAQRGNAKKTGLSVCYQN